MVGMPGTVILNMRVTTTMLARQMSARVTVVAVAEGAGLGFGGEALFHRLQPGGEPVRLPRTPRALVEISACAVRYFLMRGTMSGWVSAASIPDDARALGHGHAVSVGKQCRRGVGLFEKLENGERLCQRVGAPVSPLLRSMSAGIAHPKD